MIQSVSMTRIRCTPNNPRKKIDQKGIQELADSINQQGLLSPITVRLKDGFYEIVAGERRFLACQILGNDFIDATIRELTDREALEIALAENMIREDIHPLEETDAFLILIDEHGMTPEEIANRFGKSPSFVYKRIKLRDLSETARTYFMDGILTVTHCLELIKVSHDDQQKCLEYMIQKDTNDNEYCSQTPRNLRNFISNNIEVKLSKSCFKLDNAKLIPTAGACVTCQFRSGYNKMLFNEVESDDICYNPSCFKKKTDLHIEALTQKEIKKGNKVVELSSDYFVYDKVLKARGVIASSSWKEIPESHKCNQEEKCTAIGIMVIGDAIGSKKYVSIENSSGDECECLDVLYFDDDLEKYVTEFPEGEEPTIKKSKAGSMNYKNEDEDQPTKEQVKESCLKLYTDSKALEELEIKMLDCTTTPSFINDKFILLLLCMYVKYMDQQIFFEMMKPFISNEVYETLQENDEDENALFIVNNKFDLISANDLLVQFVINDAINTSQLHWYKNSIQKEEAPNVSAMVFELLNIDVKANQEDFKLIWDKFELLPAKLFDDIDMEDMFEFINGKDNMDLDDLQTIIKICEIEIPENSEPSEEELKMAIKEHFDI